MDRQQKSSGLIGQRSERIAKLKKLQELGINPFPSKSSRSHYTNDVLANFAQLENSTVTLSGRLMSWRDHGKLAFANLQDTYGQIQLFMREGDMQDTNVPDQLIGFAERNLLDVGDIVQVEGTVIKTKTDEISILVTKLKILTKAIRPLPEKWTGLRDEEILFRQRYLDMIMNPEKRYRFAKTAEITFAIREFLNSRGFLEIKTPILQPVYGGTNANPFKTHVRALNEDFYLAIAHELYLKRLIVAGFENVYNIYGYFRNEGIDRTHNPEFSMVETMTAFQNYEYNMDLTENMYKFIAEKVFNKTTFTVGGKEIDFGKPWQKIRMVDAVKKYAGIDFETIKTIEEAHQKLKELGAKEMPKSIGEAMVVAFEEKVEKELIEPTFVYGHPVEISPLAKSMDEDPRYVERFEIFIGGIEGGDNWTELNNPLELYDRFKGQVENGRGGDDEAHPMDVEFLEAMEYGMPPTTGLGPGIERLSMMLTETEYIDDVIFFPMMKKAPVTKIQKEIYGEEYLVIEEKIEAISSTNELKLLKQDNGLLSIASEVMTKADDLVTGYLVVEDLQIAPRSEDLEKFINSILNSAKQKYTSNDDIKAVSTISRVREIYKAFNADPNSTLNSAEALIRRVVKGKDLYKINNLVDLYNAISIQHAVPMAAYDLDKLELPLEIRLAQSGEELHLIGDDQATTTKGGELVYADKKGVTCLNYNYRDINRTKITDETKRAMIFVDGNGEFTEAEVREVLSKLVSYLRQFGIGNATTYGFTNTNAATESNISTTTTDNSGKLPSREEAMNLLEEHVKDEYQKLHSKMIAAGMEAYAEKYGEDQELWYITGLLHDLDFYEYPAEHPNKGVEWYKDWGYDSRLVQAIAAHGWDRTGVKPETKLDYALIACDEMSGLIYAYAQMRPDGMPGMEAKSVNKKFKDHKFAAKLNREEMTLGMEGLGVDPSDHINLLISVFEKMPEFQK
jgi:lysyl-tRNA synthetase class 2